MTLDAPAERDTTIAEIFLAQQGKYLARTELDYLRRLATTRLSLVRVDAVEPASALSGTDLWTEERLEIREPELTRDVTPHTVLALRLITMADGTVEQDGGIYSFSAAQADVLIAQLRARWNVAHERDPGLTEAQFLKRDVPVHINHFWTDHMAVHRGADAKDIFRHPGSADPSLFDISDPRVREFAEYLDSEGGPTAMTIDQLHGYVCAVYCGPTLIEPSTWLPRVWGDDPPEFGTDGIAEKVHDGIYALAREIVGAFADGTFAPLLPRGPGPGMQNVAQGWCNGFLDGMALDDDAWDPLVDDPSTNKLLMPLHPGSGSGQCVRRGFDAKSRRHRRSRGHSADYRAADRRILARRRG
jgi:yecA family protein